jgi:hypothetical protein
LLKTACGGTPYALASSRRSALRRFSSSVSGLSLRCKRTADWWRLAATALAPRWLGWGAWRPPWRSGGIATRTESLSPVASAFVHWHEIRFASGLWLRTPWPGLRCAPGSLASSFSCPTPPPQGIAATSRRVRHNAPRLVGVGSSVYKRVLCRCNSAESTRILHPGLRPRVTRTASSRPDLTQLATVCLLTPKRRAASVSPTQPGGAS